MSVLLPLILGCTQVTTQPPSPDDPADTDVLPGDTDDPADTDAPADTDEPADTDDPADTDEPTDTDVPLPGSCALGPHALSFEITLQHAGQTRRALVDLPPGYDGTATLPLVLNFHGLLMDAELQRSYTGMSPAANARGWIAVHPDAAGISWNILPGSQDPGFVEALLDALEAEVCVDTGRVYSTGLSNGGFFSYMLGCTIPDRVAAIAPVAGMDSNVLCGSGTPVPLLHIHGTGDTIVTYGGGLGYPSAPASVEGWATDVNGCAASPVVTLDTPGVLCETRSCGPDDEATLCSLDDVGHVWPGALAIPLLPGSTQALDANSTILDFFDDYTR